MNPYSFSLLCFAFCSFLLGLLVFLKRQDEIGKQYLFVGITQAGWGICTGVYLSLNSNYELALFFGKTCHLFALFIPTTWYQFIVSYTGRKGKKKFLQIVEILCLIFVPFIFSPWFVSKMVPIAGFTYYVQIGPLYHLFTALFFIMVPLSFLQLLRKIKVTSSPENRQYIGLFWAAFAGYLGGSLTFLPAYGIPFPQYGTFLLPIYPFGVAYFMIKRGLFDIEELAQAAHRDKLMAIGVLAASINHEVKNPLFVIKGLAETWLEQKKEHVFKDKDQIIEKGEESFTRSIEQTDRAMDIIKRLSLFAKAGIEGEIKFEAVSVAGVLEDILPLVRYELAANSITLTRDMPKNLPEVQVDRRYLEEILFNLIVNACQALKDSGKTGEIKITAKTGDSGLGTRSSFFLNQRVPSDKSQATAQVAPVLITIQDNGPGIPKEEIPNIFRPFYTTKAEGTGLGLYITKQLVEKIHGRIDIRSSLGSGTAFTVSLSSAIA